jgi:hypothetical protein
VNQGNVITLSDRRRLMQRLVNEQRTAVAAQDGSVGIDSRRATAQRALEYAVRQAYALLGDEAARRLVQEVQAAVRCGNERRW